MKCPACSKPMIVLEIEDVEIDHCVGCGGVWLDAGELELLLEKASNRNELMATLSRDIEGKEKRIRCPICSKRLEKVRYGTDKKLVLDKCPRNDGLWFDRGELCDVLQMGQFTSGKPVYDILNEIFGDKCQNSLSE
ncbi:MAG: zf-TFIIB domain-containing protein [Candidatus Latescibacterota bacterium]|nr:MAG: zf-TFIIB domain-containing protein [Candidatus Latescibacterota bacterium]